MFNVHDLDPDPNQNELDPDQNEENAISWKNLLFVFVYLVRVFWVQ